MDPKSMTRKDFIILTFTLAGSAVAASCSSDSTTTTGTGGFGGFGGFGGTTGLAGHGGITGHAGSTGTAGAAGAAGTPGTSGTTGTAGAAGGGGTGAIACTNPLPEKQDADLLMHVHMVTVPASTLSATTDQTFTTTSAAAPGGAAHMHMIVLTPTHLATLKGGGTVDVASQIADGHVHSFTIGCTSV